MDTNYRTFSINDVEYRVELVSQEHVGPIDSLYNMLFRFHKSGEKEDKRLLISITDRVEDMWQANAKSELTQITFESFAWQLIPFFISEVDDFLQIYFCRDEITEKKDTAKYIQAARTIGETSRKIIFSSSQPSNSLIRREILKVCYNEWQKNPHDYVSRKQLLDSIPVSEAELERNLSYLVEGYYLKGTLTTAGYLQAKIIKDGIDVFENPDQFNRLFALNIEQQTVNVGGDLITSVLVGNDNSVNVKSQITEDKNKSKP